MTLTTHAVVGSAAMTASVAALGPTPAGLALGFAAGFASHFVIDAIPHWDEGGTLLRSRTRSKTDVLATNVITGEHAARDFVLVSADGLFGLAASIFIFSFWLFAVSSAVVFLGAAAGELPDALQLLYMKTRSKIMQPLQRFHSTIQTELASPLFFGIELALILLVVGALKLFV